MTPIPTVNGARALGRPYFPQKSRFSCIPDSPPWDARLCGDRAVRGAPEPLTPKKSGPGASANSQSPL